MPESARWGVLYVVATPIGNLGDLSPRARDTLTSCEVLACEDTRVARRLFPEGGHLPRLLAYHEHNEAAAAAQLADLVAEGRAVALVSDAGTPAVSDPGFRAVRECRRRGLPVVPVPGPNAAVGALSASGLPSDGFLFLGFLPAKTAARRRTFAQYREFPYTVILYESVHRIEKALADIEAELGAERVICVAREVTKLHETIHTGTIAEVASKVAKEAKKGEFVVLIAKEGFTL